MTVPVPQTLTFTDDGDGSTVTFAYPVRFLEPGELVVTIERADGSLDHLSYPLHYSVSGVNQPNGGSVTLASPPAVGTKVIRSRATAPKQIVDLSDNQRNPAEAVERQLDRMTMVLQDHAKGIAAGDAALAIERAERIAADVAEKAARITADAVERAERIAGDAGLQAQIHSEAAQRAAGDLVERNARIAADAALQGQIAGIVPAVSALTSRAEAAASTSETAAQTAQDLVEAATAGFVGFLPGQSYDWGWIIDATTYFDQDWGLITA